MHNNQQPREFARTVPSNPQKIANYRLMKGWTVEQLAAKSGTSVKTIEHMEDGRRSYLSSFKKVATALGIVDVREICRLSTDSESAPAEMPSPQHRPQFVERRAIFRLKTPPEQFSECEDLEAFLQAVFRLLRPGHEILVESVTISSVLVSLIFADEDAHHLIDAIADGSFAELYDQIESVTFEDINVPPLDPRVPIMLFGIAQNALPPSRSEYSQAEIAAFQSAVVKASERSTEGFQELLRFIEPPLLQFIDAALAHSKAPASNDAALHIWYATVQRLIRAITTLQPPKTPEQLVELLKAAVHRKMWEYYAARNRTSHEAYISRSPDPSRAEREATWENDRLQELINEHPDAPRRILQMMVAGRSQRQIATALSASRATVRLALRHLLTKPKPN